MDSHDVMIEEVPESIDVFACLHIGMYMYIYLAAFYYWYGTATEALIP